jgi:hypothetical protein
MRILPKKIPPLQNILKQNTYPFSNSFPSHRPNFPANEKTEFSSIKNYPFSQPLAEIYYWNFEMFLEADRYTIKELIDLGTVSQ